ncbi:Serine/threonine kinase [Sorochytrium milnesiophthora]
MTRYAGTWLAHAQAASVFCDIDAKIAELTRKIEVEMKLKEGGEAMKTKLVDRNALAQCVASLQETQKRIDYLEAELTKLKSKRTRMSTGHNNSDSMAELAAAQQHHQQQHHHHHQHSLSASMPSSAATATSPQQSAAPDASTNLTQSQAVKMGSSGNLLSYFKKTLSGSAHLSSSDAGGSMGGGLAGSRGKSASTTGSSGQLGNGNTHLDPELAMLLSAGPPAIAQDQQDEGSQSSKRAMSNLAFGKCGMPLSTAKVSYKLRDLTYKIELEQKVKDASTRMVTLYSTSEAEKRNKLEAGRNLEEVNTRIEVLKKALHKYQGLFVGDDSDEETTPGDHDAAQSPILQPRTRSSAASGAQTGTLHLHVVAARLPPSMRNALSIAKAEAYAAVVRVDGSTKAKSKPFRAPKDKSGTQTEIRFNEQFVVEVEKAQDVELLIVEQSKAGEIKSVAAIFWFRLGDAVEELSRDGPAASVAPQPSGLQYGLPNAQPALSHPTPAQSGDLPAGDQPDSASIDAWFELDPVGQVLLRVGFVKQAKPKRQPSRLGRQGAVRKRKQIQSRMNGHRFTMQPAYSVLKCALCSEFIGIGSAYQCDECRFACHKKCVSRVVTTCIGASADEKDAEGNKNEDAQLISHNIPHRFAPSTNLSANWCCHCGHMVQLGKKIYRCTDCHLTAHKACSLLVPNFCGMSMKMANQMIQEIKAANELRKRAIEMQKRQTEQDAVRQQNIDAQAAIAQRAQSPVAVSPQQQLPHVEVPQLPQINAISPVLQQPVAAQLPSPKQPSLTTLTPVASPLAPSVLTQASDATSPFASQKSLSGSAEAIKQSTASVAPAAKKVTLDDFQFLAVLGKGNFGKVMLAEAKATKQLFAIKVLKKDFIIENDEVESTRSEKRIFLTANSARHPFLIGLHSCIQTETRIYFIMEYVPGGDLMLHIQREQFTERRAKFYACEVLLALEFFHKNNIVYRDLKLDNIMLGLDGHIKLADYGLCKENMGYGATTNTFCGTPEFMAPEARTLLVAVEMILVDQSYGLAVDWWALGVLIYEMICGASPFKGEDEDEIFESILEDEVLYPTNMSRDAVSICQRLLTKNPAQRLGAGPSDSEEIKQHPFFRGISWDDIYHKRIPPPFAPKKPSHAADVSNFDAEFTREMPVLTPIQTVLNEAEQAEFRDFSYVADWTQTQ